MARKIMGRQPDGTSLVLSERRVHEEAQLQELLKGSPELLPLDDFGLTGPPMVLGEETTLPSGAVDLIVATRDGAILVVEFKTGPENADFRRAVAQLLDYGSDLWRLTFEEFENAVAVRYFSSERCRDPKVKDVQSLQEAAHRIWEDLTAEEWSAFKEQLTRQLTGGLFRYVLAAQQFTPSSLRTIEYLNAAATGPEFYAVELVQFEGQGVVAFESRIVEKPSAGGRGKRSAASEASLLDRLEDDEYRLALEDLLAAVNGLGLRIEWGSVGCSIRLATSYRLEPVTIAWLFPPQQSGWMGLMDLTLGFDLGTVDTVPGAKPAFERYAEKVKGLEGAREVRPRSLRAYHMVPGHATRQLRRIVDIVAELAAEVGA